MATYVKEQTRGKTLHLIDVGKQINGAQLYVNATDSIKEAIQADAARGYEGVGPNAAQEIERAKEFAEYLFHQPITTNDLDNYRQRNYDLFLEPEKQPRRKPVKTDVRAHVPA